MIRWLHRYIFRGLGLVFVIGMLTLLWLAIMSRPSLNPRPVAPATR